MSDALVGNVAHCILVKPKLSTVGELAFDLLVGAVIEAPTLSGIFRFLVNWRRRHVLTKNGLDVEFYFSCFPPLPDQLLVDQYWTH